MCVCVSERAHCPETWKTAPVFQSSSGLLRGPSFVLGPFLIKLIGDWRMNSTTYLSLFHFPHSPVQRQKQRAISGVEVFHYKDSFLVSTWCRELPLQICLLWATSLIINIPRLQTCYPGSFWHVIINAGEDLWVLFAVSRFLYITNIHSFLLWHNWPEKILQKKPGELLILSLLCCSCVIRCNLFPSSPQHVFHQLEE